MKKKKQIKILRSEKEYEEYGKISKITFPDNSKIFISKKGWTLVLANKDYKKNMAKARKFRKIEMTMPYSEINVAIQETIKAGYK